MTGLRALRLVPRTLRGRLLAGIVLLVTAGLLGSDLAIYTLLRSYFDTRAERQLTRTADRIDLALAHNRDVQTIEQTLQVFTGGRVQAMLVNGSGQLVPRRSPTGTGPGTVIVDATTVTRLRHRAGRSERLKTAAGVFRFAYFSLDGTAHDRETGIATPVGGVILAVSQRTDEETLHQFAVDAAVVTALALLALVLLGFGVLRVGLRPLKQMAIAASAIAEGDRTRRIQINHAHTEAGQLGVALNRAFERQHGAEEQLRRFVADVSHELRTPLSTIGGWADLYFHGGLTDPDATTTAMSRIADEAAGMRSLVEELLLLASLDQQRPIERTSVPLARLVGEVVADARVIDPDRRITLSVPAQDSCAVLGDANRLRQLTRNLLSNALQHTPPGTPIQVTVGNQAAASRVFVTVADQGPGIPPTARPHLFERFYQGDPARRRGSGLGLAIARAIVEAHDGTIQVRDPVSGPGSEFHVRLPIASNSG